ncbi:MAG TPA: tetratricopeptide repeat protein [Caulobacteraceae bacterium]|nr:tetratricopeptide repeat protein [Caulobacteraceae bacterium]
MPESHASGARRFQATPFGVAAVLAVIGAVAIAVASCEQRPDVGLWKTSAKENRYACPRPSGPSGVQPGFNDQEREIRHLRRLAFSNDFFAQLELGRRYQAVRAVDKNIEDPIESAVWYALALSNAEGYAPINRAVKPAFGALRPISRYDDCRAWERHVAYDALDKQLERMSTEEQEKVRNRVIYILSTMDAEGFRTLARLYDGLYGPYGEPADNAQAMEAAGRPIGGGKNGGYRAAVSLFPRNDVDAYLYNYLAVQTGDVGAYVLLKDFERSAPQRANYGAFVEAKAKRWVPPYEFYPPEAPETGVPHSDESRVRGDAWDFALAKVNDLPFVHVGRALQYLGITTTVPASPTELSQRQIETLEAMLGHPMEGRLSNLEKVRAIQYAAINGSAQAQLVLAVMYAEGVGVPADYARAFHWFSEADRQGSPEAKFAMSTYFALGVAGVADQDKAKAVVYRMESALAGFKPSVSRIQAVLAQVSRAPRRQIQ